MRSTLAEDIANMLGERILKGTWASGDKITSTARLAKELGVSTGTIREAIRILQTKSVLTVKHGSGTYVANPESLNDDEAWQISLPDSKDFVAILEARVVVETGIVRLAAHKGSSAEIVQLKAALDRMTMLKSESFDFVAADIEFHATLAKMSGNEILEHVFLGISETLSRLILSISMHSGGSEELEGPLEAHGELVSALEAQDILRAGAALARIHEPAFEFMRKYNTADATKGVQSD